MQRSARGMLQYLLKQNFEFEHQFLLSWISSREIFLPDKQVSQKWANGCLCLFYPSLRPGIRCFVMKGNRANSSKWLGNGSSAVDSISKRGPWNTTSVMPLWAAEEIFVGRLKSQTPLCSALSSFHHPSGLGVCLQLWLMERQKSCFLDFRLKIGNRLGQ